MEPLTLSQVIGKALHCLAHVNVQTQPPLCYQLLLFASPDAAANTRPNGQVATAAQLSRVSTAIVRGVCSHFDLLDQRCSMALHQFDLSQVDSAAVGIKVGVWPDTIRA